MSDASSERDRLEFQRLGIYDPTAPDAEDHLRLLRHLIAHGASETALVAAARQQRLGGLALDLALSHGVPVPFADGAAAAGLAADTAARLWRAFGLPDPSSDPPALTPDAIEALRFVGSTAADVLGSDATLALARLLGATTSRLAEATVDTFRLHFELPARAQGRPYSRLVEDYAELANALLPQFLDALAAIFRRHLVAFASGRWSLDAERATTQRTLVVGFVDLVGYTALSRALSARQLADLLGRFEAVVEDSVATHRGRLVKLLGDGAMFVAEDPNDACRLALNLLDALAADPDLPPARVGMAAGSVVALNGDYQGPVVNVAARLAGAAPPVAVVVDAEVQHAAASGFVFEPHRVAALKGFPSPPPMFVVRRRSRPG
jgi:adenylate cyclase